MKKKRITDDSPTKPKSPVPPAPPAEEPKGPECRHCGCHHFFVVVTRPLPGGKILRRRECRNCGRRLTTYEQAP